MEVKPSPQSSSTMGEDVGSQGIFDTVLDG
jgi:hypothetical protein